MLNKDCNFCKNSYLEIGERIILVDNNEWIHESCKKFFYAATGIEMKRKSQMTREEAKRRVEKICGLPLGQGNIVDALEALGLIKFEEPIQKSIDDCLTPCFGSFAGRDAVKKALDDAGYKIVKK